MTPHLFSRSLLSTGALLLLSACAGENSEGMPLAEPMVSEAPPEPLAEAERGARNEAAAAPATAAPQPEQLIESEPEQIVETPPNENCANASVESRPAPVALFVAFDRSGSMGFKNTEERWVPVTTALKAFFKDPASEGLSAALSFFPAFEGENRTTNCMAESYEVGDVPLSSLPNELAFSTVIDAKEPAGLTPTLPILRGLAKQADAALAADPSAKVAIVMVTDGEPNGCNDFIPDVAAGVLSFSDRIPTYVIGVGDELEDLNQIADAGCR